MAIGLKNFPNITSPDSDFPDGRIKDDTGAEDGTPINLLTNGDLQEFPAKLMRLMGITPNGLPDSEYIGHQYLEALWKFGNSYFASDLIKGLVATYTTNDLIVLWGCTVTANIPGTSTITAGAIFYNEIIYKVPASSISSPSNTLVFTINGLDVETINLINAVSATGIADYNGPTVKLLYNEIIRNLNPESWNAPILNSGWSNSSTTNPVGYYYDKVAKTVRLKGLVTYTSSTPGATTLFTLPSNYRPGWPSKFTVYFSSSLNITTFSTNQTWTIEVKTNGDVQLMDFAVPSGSPTITIDLSSICFRVA